MDEKKFFDVTPAGGAVPATWTWSSFLQGLNQGTSASGRIGNKIYVHQINFFAQISPLVTIAAAGSVCRLVIYHNKEAAGAVPSATPSVFDSDKVIAARYIPTRPRYTIMKDQSMVHTPLTGTGGAAVLMAGKTTLKMTVYPKKRVDYSSTGGGIADLFKDDYGLGMIADGANCCTIEWRAQVIYSDA